MKRKAALFAFRNFCSNASSWLSLLRLPNLLTVPGDPVAGGILAAAILRLPVNWDSIRSCALASLCLYSAGLLANDYFDRNKDGTERPDRPIPSNKLQPGPVLGCAALLTAAAVSFAAQAGLSALKVAVFLAIAAWSYNLGLKHIPVIGPLVMGSCRSLSFLLGSAAIGSASLLSPTLLIPAATLGLLIAAITTLARRETEFVSLPRWLVPLPPLILLAGLYTLLFICRSPFAIHRPPSPFLLLLAAMPVVWSALITVPLFGRPAPSILQSHIGALIRGLILYQAALCAYAGGCGEMAALVVLAAFPVAGWLGKSFKGS